MKLYAEIAQSVRRRGRCGRAGAREALLRLIENDAAQQAMSLIACAHIGQEVKAR